MKPTTILIIGLAAIISCYLHIMGSTISNFHDARIAWERIKFDIRTSFPSIP